MHAAHSPAASRPGRGGRDARSPPEPEGGSGSGMDAPRPLGPLEGAGRCACSPCCACCAASSRCSSACSCHPMPAGIVLAWSWAPGGGGAVGVRRAGTAAAGMVAAAAGTPVVSKAAGAAAPVGVTSVAGSCPGCSSAARAAGRAGEEGSWGPSGEAPTRRSPRPGLERCWRSLACKCSVAEQAEHGVAEYCRETRLRGSCHGQAAVGPAVAQRVPADSWPEIMRQCRAAADAAGAW